MRQKINYDCLTGLLFALDRFKQEGKIDARHWDELEDDALVKGPVELKAAIRHLKDLAQFRAAIGYFPGEYVPDDEPAKSEQRAAFVRAWSEHCKKRGLPVDTNLAVSAWQTYHKIKSGTFRASEALQ